MGVIPTALGQKHCSCSIFFLPGSENKELAKRIFWRFIRIAFYRRVQNVFSHEDNASDMNDMQKVMKETLHKFRRYEKSEILSEFSKMRFQEKKRVNVLRCCW